MRLLSTLALGAFVLPVAAQAAADRHSYAQPKEVVINHIDLNLKVDFSHKQLDGVATLTLDWKSASAQDLVLDTENLKIASIEAVDGKGHASALKYQLAAPAPNMVRMSPARRQVMLSGPTASRTASSCSGNTPPMGR